MAISTTTGNAFLNALCRNVPFSVAEVWVQLHTGDPGAAGTSNQAGNNIRKLTTFSAASDKAITNDALVTWAGVSTAEDYEFFSAWSASSGGTFLFSGTLTADAVLIGDTFSFNPGDFLLSIA